MRYSIETYLNIWYLCKFMKKIAHRIGFGVPNIDDKAKKYVMDVLNTQRLSYGPYCKKLEDFTANWHGAKYGVVSNSGTSALRVAVATLKELHNWKDNDEIICPSSTFVATSNVVIMNNLKPVFVDVEKEYYCIDPKLIEAKITNKTRAIMVVHHYGLPADMFPILDIAKKHNLKVIEDSCETWFAKYNGKPAGCLGDIGCFSTYVAHNITTGVGGISITNNELYAKIMRSYCNHGRNPIYISIDDDFGKREDELQGIIDKRFSFERLGYSFRITEMEAALGVAQLERWESIISKRQENAQYFTEHLKKFEKYLQLPKIRPGCSHSFMMYPVVIKDPRIKKKDLVLFLENNNVTTRNMNPLMRQPIYLKLFGDLYKQYPVTQWIDENGFYFGCHQELTLEEKDYIIALFTEFFDSFEKGLN